MTTSQLVVLLERLQCCILNPCICKPYRLHHRPTASPLADLRDTVEAHSHHHRCCRNAVASDTPRSLNILSEFVLFHAFPPLKMIIGPADGLSANPSQQCIPGSPYIGYSDVERRLHNLPNPPATAASTFGCMWNPVLPGFVSSMEFVIPAGDL